MSIQKTTIKRGNQTFEFENTENISDDQFLAQCNEKADAAIASEKYTNLYSALRKQIASGNRASDYEEAKAHLLAFEREYPEQSRGYYSQLCAADGTEVKSETTSEKKSEEKSEPAEEETPEQKAFNKYENVAKALMKQVEEKSYASDYEQAKIFLLEFENNNPELSKGYYAELSKLDGSK